MDPLSAVGEQPDSFIPRSSAPPSRSYTLATATSTSSSGHSGSGSSFDINSDPLLLRHTGSGFAEWTFADNDSPVFESTTDDGGLSLGLGPGHFNHPECSFSVISQGQEPINCEYDDSFFFGLLFLLFLINPLL